MTFKDKVIIVTGSSSGIGQEAALIFAKKGAFVTIHGQNPDRLKQTKDLLKKANVPDSHIHVVQGPIEDEETQKRLINETVEKFGRLNILINNAGTPRHPDLDANSLDNLDFVLDTNLRSVIALTRLAVPHLEKTKGNVVNVSSGTAQRASLHAVPYSLSKAALNHFTRNAAVQYASQGIRVNTVSPGVTRTNFGKRYGLPDQAIDKFYEQIAESAIPLQRLGTAKEVANVIEFVASDKASYVTGSLFNVDGGLLAGPPESKVSTDFAKMSIGKATN